MTTALGGRIFPAVVVVVVVASVIGGIVLIGSPGEQRARRLDGRRISDLRGITRALDRYWSRHKSLPGNLVVLRQERCLNAKTSDPETGQTYVYRQTGTDSYELCAVFSAESSVDWTGPSNGNALWSHGRGRHCFKLAPRRIARSSCF